MPVNAAIPLQARGPELMNPAQVLSLQQLSQQGQMQQQAMQEKDELRNALRGGVDPTTGRLSLQGLSNVTQINPQLGLQLTEQQERLRLQDVANMEKRQRVAVDVGTSYVSAYDRYLQQTGGNKEQALNLARADALAAIDELDKSGRLRMMGLGDKEIADLRSLQDPERTRNIVHALGGKIEKPQGAAANIGKVDPKDYTPESFAQYVATNDPTKLRKLETPKEKEVKPPETRTRFAGEMEIQEEFDPKTSTWKKIGERPRVAQPREDKKPTDAENISAGYATRMYAAADIMSALEKKGIGKPENLEAAAKMLPGGAGKIASNMAMSEDRQKYRQAQEDWVRAKLRKESGAVIGDEEMDREIRVYFPQIGDSDAVIKQKADARGTAEKAMEQSAGKATVTKQDSGMRAKVEGAGWNYEPAKYEYRIGHNGKPQRKLRG